MRLLAIIFVFLLAACGGEDSYDTLSACVDDHVEEGLAEPMAIAHCLYDYPFGDGLTTQDECVAYVTANGDYPDSRDEGCTLFLEESGL